MKKKLLAVLLTMALALSFLPCAAFASIKVDLLPALLTKQDLKTGDPLQGAKFQFSLYTYVLEPDEPTPPTPPEPPTEQPEVSSLDLDDDVDQGTDVDVSDTGNSGSSATSGSDESTPSADVPELASLGLSDDADQGNDVQNELSVASADNAIEPMATRAILTPVGTATVAFTDENGQITADLQQGMMAHITEIEPAPGYILDEPVDFWVYWTAAGIALVPNGQELVIDDVQMQEITVANSGAVQGATPIVKNTPENLRTIPFLKKVDAASGKGLEGAQLTISIYDEAPMPDGSSRVETNGTFNGSYWTVFYEDRVKTTDTDGLLKEESLAGKLIHVIEEQPAPGYKLDQPVDFWFYVTSANEVKILDEGYTFFIAYPKASRTVVNPRSGDVSAGEGMVEVKNVKDGDDTPEGDTDKPKGEEESDDGDEKASATPKTGDSLIVFGTAGVMMVAGAVAVAARKLQDRSE